MNKDDELYKLNEQKTTKTTSHHSGSMEGMEEMEEMEASKTSKPSKPSLLPLTQDVDFWNFHDSLSENRKILLYYLAYGDLTDKKLAELMSLELSKPAIMRNKPSMKGLVVKKSNSRPAAYGLTVEAHAQINGELQAWISKEKAGRERLEEQQIKEQAQRERYEEEATLKNRCDEFIQDEISDLIGTARNTASRYVVVPFARFSEYMPEFGEVLLERPKDVLRTLSWVYSTLTGEKLFFMIKDLPSTSRTTLKGIHQEHVGKLYQVDVEVTGRTEIGGRKLAVEYICNACGNLHVIPQDTIKLAKPRICACGLRSPEGFKEVGSNSVDEIACNCTEPLANLYGDDVRRSEMPLFLQDVLASPEFSRGLQEGSILRVVAYVEQENVPTKNGSLSTKTENVLRGVYYEFLEKPELADNFTEEQVLAFQEAAKKPGFLDEISKSIFKKHYGDDEIKKALALQLVAGAFDEYRKEENLHILLVGDPATGKSTNLLRPAQMVAPISYYVEATRASKAGLTASAAQKDRHTNKPRLELGALPRHHRGLVMIDELSVLDEGEQKNTKATNEIMDVGSFAFNKAGVNMRLSSDVRILSATNPPGGRLDDHTTFEDAIKHLEESHVSRYALVFLLRDLHEQTRDKAIANKILFGDKESQTLDEDFIKAYIRFVRHRIKPRVRDEEKNKVNDIYVKLRQQPEVAITPRYVEGVVALLALLAKIHLREETNEQDLKVAITILNKSHGGVFHV